MSRSNKQAIRGDNNMQIGHNSGPVTINQRSKEDSEKLDQILSMLRNQQTQSPAPPPTSQEDQANKEVFAHWIASTQRERQQALQDIRQGNIEAGIKRLQTLDKDQADQIIDTKLQLAAIFNYSDPIVALRYLSEAVAIAPEHLAANNLYGLLLMRLGEVEQAKGVFIQAHQAAQQQKSNMYEGYFLGNLGLAYAKLGEVEKAIGYYEQALKISRDIGDRQGEGSCLGNLGVAYTKLGNAEKAVGYHRQSIIIFEAIKSPNAEVAKGLLRELTDRSSA